MSANPSPAPHRPKDTQPFYIVGGGLLILFLVLALPAIREWLVWARLQGESHTTEARITALSPQPTEDPPDGQRTILSSPMTGFSVSYTFTADGSSFVGNSRIDQSAWRAYEVGGSITVRYAATNPRISAIHGDDYARLTSTLYLILPLLGFAALWGSWKWEARRQSRKPIPIPRR